VVGKFFLGRHYSGFLPEYVLYVMSCLRLLVELGRAESENLGDRNDEVRPRVRCFGHEMFSMVMISLTTHGSYLLLSQ